MELKDKVVVITGGSKGIGRTMAEALIAEGAKVAICSHNQAEITQTAEKIGALGIFADVTEEEQLIRLAKEAENKLGPVDIWINNAGIFRERKNVEDFDMANVREIFEVNVIGLINGSRVALRLMKPRKNGTIINILSTAALKGREKISVYASSKWAANGFTESIREENKDTGIKILSVFPGGVKTGMYGEDKTFDFDQYKEPKEIAEKVIENLKRETPETHLIISRTPLKWPFL